MNRTQQYNIWGFCIEKKKFPGNILRIGFGMMCLWKAVAEALGDFSVLDFCLDDVVVLTRVAFPLKPTFSALFEDF